MTCRPASPRVWCLVAVFSLLTFAPAVADDDVEARWQAVEAKAVEDLHELGLWCLKVKLYGARAEVYETVLTFDPDDETARKWLRFKRSAEGDWVRRPGYKRPKNRSNKLPVYEARKKAWQSWFLSETRAYAQAAATAECVDLRDRILGLGYAIAPDDPILHRVVGEVPSPIAGGSRWILAESARALKRRGELLKMADEAIAAVPAPADGVPVELDGLGDVPWGPVLQGRLVRVLGVPDPEEMEKQLVHCEATWPVYEGVFGIEFPPWETGDRYAPTLTVYVLTNMKAGNDFLAAQPDIEEQKLAFLNRLVLGWIPGRPAIVVKTPVAAARLEAGAKAILAAMCRWTLGITVERAWASEGLAHYLTYLISRTHIIATVQDKTAPTAPAAQPGDKPASSTPTGDAWLIVGRDLLASDKKPDIHLMAGKNVNAITHDEVIYGYCLTAYVIEGFPERARAFFEAVGKAPSSDLTPAVREHLDMDVPTLEARLVRWLRETHPPPPEDPILPPGELEGLK